MSELTPMIKLEDYRDHQNIAWSDLRLLKESPLKFWTAKYDHAPFEKHVSSGYHMGDLVDCQILTPDMFDSQYVLRPDFKTPSNVKHKAVVEDWIAETGPEGNMAPTKGLAGLIYQRHYVTDKKSPEKIVEEAWALLKQYEDYIDFTVKLGGRTAYSPKDQAILNYVTASLDHSKVTRSWFFDDSRWSESHNQFPLLVDIVVGGGVYSGKGLVDRLCIDDEAQEIWIIDLKTTSRPMNHIPWMIAKYQYHKQLWYYGWLAWHMLLQQGRITDEMGSDWKLRFGVAFVQTVDMYEVYPIELKGSILEEAQNDVMELVLDFMWYSDTDAGHHFGAPRILQENNGLLPLDSWDLLTNSDLSGTNDSEESSDEAILESFNDD